MKISGLSNSTTKYAQPAAAANSNSTQSLINALQKQKTQLQDQVKQVQQSKMSTEMKQNKIKELDDQIKALDKQIADAIAKKRTEEQQKASEAQSNDQDDEEDAQVLNEKVVTGLVSATNSMKKGDAAFTVYKKEAAKVIHPDINKMERALSYAMPEYQKALQSSKLVEEGLQESKALSSKEDENDKRVQDTEKLSSEPGLTQEQEADGSFGLSEEEMLKDQKEDQRKRIDIRI
ncbi:hypothetical protein GCM10023310_24150 [Paenibacillus vulneris]|uniref:FlxA-like family protein n=1 Tax=Paenibacillus vulneris TaxID=1133364 RepID=A0ABW3UWX2_9BACL